MEEQYDWVGWRIQDHYRESERICFLFGKITGYAYQPTLSEYIPFDITGNWLEPVVTFG